MDTVQAPVQLTGLQIKQIEFAKQYVKNGFNGSAAYKTICPDCVMGTARNQAATYLQEPFVQEQIQALTSVEKPGQIRKKFIQKVNRITDKAEGVGQYSAALKGCELEAKVEGLFSQEEGDTAQYMQFFDKVSIVVNSPLMSGKLQDMKVIENDTCEMEKGDTENAQS